MLFRVKYLIVLPLVLLLFSCNGENIKVYEKDDILFSDISEVGDNKVKIYFTAMAETLFYCPGVNFFEEQEGIFIEFVRCSIKETCNVNYPTKRDSDGEYILLEGSGKKIFFKSGPYLNKIFPKS